MDRAAWLEAAAKRIGGAHVLVDPADMAPYLGEWRGLFQGEALAVLRPGCTAEVAALVQLCARTGTAIVPQGGNTGLVGGSTAYDPARQVILSLGRMNRIRNLDPVDYTVTVEAGCVLQELQQAADGADRLFPLALGAQGSCQIGGNISTNAGGLMTLRYGNMRDLVLGLEVVLPDGRVWNGLNALRKNNTGYDLKHLFIGGEGTLGIVTAAVLKLFPKPRQMQTAMLGVPAPEAAIALFARLRAATGDALAAYELMPRRGLEFAFRHVAGAADPLPSLHPWYVLLELTSSREGTDLRDALESALADGFESGFVRDAVLADSLAQAGRLWHLREALVEAQRHEGGSIKHDVSVPVSRIPEFLDRALAAVEAAVPGIRPVPFGHVGDGNIHFNLTQPEGADRDAYLARWAEINRIVHDIVVGLGGSFSAEHGIGRLKRDELAHYKDPVELDLMRAVKSALDPDGRMNPGKLL